MAWQLQAAKQRFSELVRRAQREGSQVVTKRGREAVVVVSAEEYRRLKGPGDNLIGFLRSAPDFDLLDLRRASDRP
jgi:prevent-host-death family protein